METDTKEDMAVRIDREHYEAIRKRAEAEQRTIKTVLGNILAEALGIKSDDSEPAKDAN